MFCPKCGMQNSDSNVICANCGVALSQNQQPPQPPISPEGSQAQGNINLQKPTPDFQQQPNPSFQQQPNQGFQQPPFQQAPPVNGTPYLVWSIIATVLCCWLFIPLGFGIPAIVYASKINRLVNLGDIFGAQEAAKKSKMFTIIAGIVGTVLFIIWMVVYLFIFKTMIETGNYTYN